MTEKEIKYHNLYLDIAERISKMSYAKRLQVGSVLVKDDNIISFGWNGQPARFDNNCENYMGQDENGNDVLKTKSTVLHAEMNCLAKLAKSHNSSVGADLYITHAPCIECAKLIHCCGIKRLFYRNIYRCDDGIKFLSESCGVEVVKL